MAIPTYAARRVKAQGWPTTIHLLPSHKLDVYTMRERHGSGGPEPVPLKANGGRSGERHVTTGAINGDGIMYVATYNL